MTTSPDRLSDDLAARPSVEPGREAVKVKPLEWFQSSPATWRSQTPINGYIVEKGNKHWRVLPLTPAFIFDTEAEAKTAAQVDYERRILSALEPSSSEPSATPLRLWPMPSLSSNIRAATWRRAGTPFAPMLPRQRSLLNPR
jgi:hypothetical protein